MPLPPPAAISRWTSFVMSRTVRFGSAAAIESGISTDVMRRDLPRQPEVDVLARDGDLLDDLAVAQRGEMLDRRLDQLFGRRAPAVIRSTSCAATARRSSSLSPSISSALGAGDPRDLDEPLRIRARLRADHEDQGRLLRESLDGVLAVLGRVTDVIRGRPPERTEPLLESVDRRARHRRARASSG